MNEDFFKFPHTPHLVWLSAGIARVDKVFSAADVDAFLSGEIIVEEKVDGANLGISVSTAGYLQVQNRGNHIGPGAHPQFQPLWPWLGARKAQFIEVLGEHLLLFGEWCFAVHSVQYDNLPDWFLGFDVYDHREDRFWCVAHRNELFTQLGIHPVPGVAQGRYTLKALEELLYHTPSQVGGEALEGFYLRREQGDWLDQRAKLVRPEFIQAIEEHWSERSLKKNVLAESKEQSYATGR